MQTELKKWQLPSDYIGAEWNEYFVFLAQTRDSDALTRSNFRVALKRLGGKTGEATGDCFSKPKIDGKRDVLVIREGHWACGWVEWIAIHESNSRGLDLARKMLKEIDDYPSLDEQDWTELESSEAFEYWNNASLQERIDLCAQNDTSIFAARRADEVPERVEESLRF